MTILDTQALHKGFPRKQDALSLEGIVGVILPRIECGYLWPFVIDLVHCSAYALLGVSDHSRNLGLWSSPLRSVELDALPHPIRHGEHG